MSIAVVVTPRAVIAYVFAGLGMCSLAQAAEWQFSPSSRLTTGYTDNPRLLPEGSEAELQNGAEVGAQLRGGSERLTIAITPRASFSRYRSDQSLDTNDQSLGLSPSWQSERVVWSGNAQVVRDSTQTSELGTTGLVQDNLRRESVTAGAGPRWTVSENFTTGANVQWNDVHYADAAESDLTDYSRSSASLFGTVATSDRTRFTLTMQGGRLESSNRAGRTRDAGVTLGLSHELGPLWSLSIAAGPSWAESGLNTDRGTLYSTSVTRQGEVLQLSASASQQLNPIGSGYLSRVEAVTLLAAQRLSEHLSVSLSGQFTRNEELFNDIANAGRETRYSTATGSLNWQFAPAWTVSLSIEGRSQTVRSAADPGTNADGGRLWVGVGWNGRTSVL